MANRVAAAGTGDSAGAADRLDAGVPEAVHRSPLLADAIVQLAQRGRRGPGVRRHIGPEPGQRLRFFEDPQELAARRGGNAVQHDGPPEIEAGSDASHILAPLAPSCSTSSASTSLARMRPDASLSRYRDSARNGSRPSRSAACSTASSNGRCSKACSVLWWMKMLMGPCAGSRCASSSITRVSGWSGEPASGELAHGLHWQVVEYSNIRIYGPLSSRKGSGGPNEPVIAGELQTFKAQFFRALAHPTRIRMLEILVRGGAQCRNCRRL